MMSETLELSRLFNLEDAAAKPRRAIVEASAEECKALAKRFHILGLSALRAELVIKSDPLGYVVEGNISGQVQQKCVVSLDAVDENISDHFKTYYILTSEMDKLALDSEDDAGFDEDFEELIESQIDLGELVAQHFALALNPYPRSENAEKSAEKLGKPHNPFDVLAKLKEKG